MNTSPTGGAGEKSLICSMPRLGTLFTLLLMAAMGLPLFAIFSSVMTVLFASPSGWLPTVFLVFTIWFTAAWQYSELFHDLWLGRPRLTVIAWDAHAGEVLVLVLTVCALLAIPWISVPTTPAVHLALQSALRP